MQMNYVLIDYENVHVKSLALLKDANFFVKVFLGAKNTKLPRELVVEIQKLGNRGEYIELDTSGHNALDFHIAYVLGVLTQKDPQGFYHVISKDTGFDPLVKHLNKIKIACVRSGSIEGMSCFSGLIDSVAQAAKPKQQAAVTKAKTTPQVKPLPKTPTPKVNAQAAQVNSKAGALPKSLDDLVVMAVRDLLKRKAAKPRTAASLQSTIHAMRGLKLSEADTLAIFNALVEKGFVKVEGKKITYALPTD